ncbi:MAG: DUF721 domain-containing protein [Paludibacteraceae bacterium]|jgi:Protein of unknown function (DUF721).|nr:DUF721 domain-containing protein [Paludibacteraceae bacterium]MBO7455946.1 DUF721 domain-containing protein [Paludibacteraceae bacterium]
MKRTEAQTLGSVLTEWIRMNNLEKPLLEHRVVEQWGEILGPMIARYSRDIEIKDGMLRVRITNAALRQELFDQRFRLIQKLNDAVGGEAVKDIRLLG